MVTRWPSRLRTRVLRRPMVSTVPSTLSSLMRSPMRNGLSTKHRHRAEQVRQRVLRRQAHRQAADGQRGDGRGDVDAEVVERDQHGDDDDKELQALADDRKQLLVEGLVRLRLPCAAASKPITRSTNFSTM